MRQNGGYAQDFGRGTRMLRQNFGTLSQNLLGINEKNLWKNCQDIR
jgi:hypothetical protein